MTRLSFLFCFFFLFKTTTQAQQAVAARTSDDHVKGEILVQLTDNRAIHNFRNGLFSYLLPIDDEIETVSESMHIYSFKFDPKEYDENEVLKTLRSTPSVSAAQFNHFVKNRGNPNDPLFPQQWSLSKINAPSVWDKTTGGVTACGDTIVVAVLERGIDDRTNDDLQPNIWLNKDEIPNNNIDDDGDGYVDDYRGVAFVGGKDIHSAVKLGVSDYDVRHGLAVVGVIGAAGNNAKLLTGINWNIKIMLISGVTTDESILKAYDFILAKHKIYKSSNGKKGAFVPITNFSGGFDNSSPAAKPLLCAVYDTLGKYGILNFIAVANQGNDVEKIGDMPTLCAKQSVVSVTATDKDDVRSDYAYGQKYVHLAAPGHLVSILRSNNTSDIDSGTSFATPLAAGAAALLWSMPENKFCQLAKNDPVAAMNLVKGAILRGVDVAPSLKDKTISGGRLNIGNAYQQLRRNFGQPIGDYDILKMYPNPVDRILNVVFQLPENVKGDILVINALGQKVYQHTITDGDLLSQKIAIPTHSFSAGLYFLTFATNQFEVTKKFVVGRP
jgi:hypothetical protein